MITLYVQCTRNVMYDNFANERKNYSRSTMSRQLHYTAFTKSYSLRNGKKKNWEKRFDFANSEISCLKDIAINPVGRAALPRFYCIYFDFLSTYKDTQIAQNVWHCYVTRLKPIAFANHFPLTIIIIQLCTLVLQIVIRLTFVAEW